MKITWTIISESKAKRSLFGPVDHDILDKELNERIKEICDEKKEKWGFDFSKGEPVEDSSIEWVAINDEIVSKPSTSEDTETMTFNTKVNCTFLNISTFSVVSNLTI